MKKIDQDFIATNIRACPSSSCSSIPSSVKKGNDPLIVKDGKILRNAEIVFASFKLSSEQWAEALMNIDEKILTASCLERVLSVLPDEAVMKELAEFSGSMDSLIEAERYLAAFASFRGILPRIRAIMLKQNWNERVATIKRDFSTVKSALEELASSECLKTFLNLVLFVGNYMNRKADSVDVYGFRIKLLTKLGDVKGTSPSCNLLQTLTELMVDVFDGEHLPSQIFYVSQAQKIDLEVAKNSLNALAKESKMTENYITGYQPQGSRDKFKDVMTSFVPAMKADIELIESVRFLSTFLFKIDLFRCTHLLKKCGQGFVNILPLIRLRII